MLNRKESKIITVGIISFAVVALIGLVYSAFTGQLNITGKSVGRHSKWDIHFQNVSTITTNGTSKVLNNGQPTINENNPTQIENYDVSFTTPGDSISFTFDIVNDGNYDALITSVDVDTPECDVNGDQTDTSAVNMCKYLEYKITYDGGAEINQNSDTVYAKDKVILKVTLIYKEFSDASELPAEDVNISNLGIQIDFEQQNNALVKDNGEVANYRVYHQGDKITLNNEDYWVIADSGADKDYVVALKDKPLAVEEVNTYGGVGTENNHVNVNDAYIIGQAANYKGFGGISYYSSETCGYVNGSNIETGCTTDYNLSDIKYVVDKWYQDKFTNNQLKEVEGYSARLITLNELENKLGCVSKNCANSSYNWIYNTSYWTSSVYGNTSSHVYSVNSKGNISATIVYRSYLEYTVRPVINVYKSALETQ